jgi:hypothetical protein
MSLAQPEGCAHATARNVKFTNYSYEVPVKNQPHLAAYPYAKLRGLAAKL